MKINIIYEVNNREYNNCLLIQQELRRRGHDVRIYNKTENYLLFRKADVTIIPNSYRTSDVENYRYTFNTRNNIIIAYPCEQVTNHRLPKFFDYSDKNEAKRLPTLCWGEDYFNFISNIGFDMTFSYITGAVQLDFCRENFKTLFHSKRSLSQEYNIPLNKRWILFVSDFVLASDLKLSQLKDSKDEDGKILDSLSKHERKTQEQILIWFEQLLQSSSEDIIIYRKHPVEMLTNDVVSFQQKNSERFFLISDYNIKEWLINCETICTWNSTSLVECYAANKSVQLLRPYPFSDDIKKYEYTFYLDYPKITSFNEFKSAIHNSKNHITSNIENEIQKLYSIDEIPSFIRVADAIEKISNDFPRPPIEKYYQFKRWKHFFTTGAWIKIPVKKIVQGIYLLSKVHYSKQTESKYAINEWLQSADNKRKSHLLLKQINKIISKY